MLFRLGLTVEDAIEAYATLWDGVFSKKPVFSRKKKNASRLEDAIVKVIHRNLDIDENRAKKTRMLDDKWSKCFVIASTARNSSPTLFRTYVPPRHPSFDCTIVEALRATTAEDPFFPSIDIGDANIRETFIHVDSHIENPVKAVLEEAESIFPGQSISCVLSVGSGIPTSTNDSERISDEVAKRLSDSDVFYCRLNVDHGFEDIGFKDRERLGDVKTHTGKYLAKHDVDQKVSQLVEVLNRRTVIASNIEETTEALGRHMDSILPEEGWSQVISKFIRIVKPSRLATGPLDQQCALLCETLEICMQGKKFVELPNELNGNVKQLLQRLLRTFHDAPGQEDPIAYLNAKMQALLERFWIQNHIAGNIVVPYLLKYVQRDDPIKETFTPVDQHDITHQNLGNLNLAPSAMYNSSEASERESCLKGTRVKLLNEIASWIADPSLAPIYVLEGVAGIGKSTIAQTVAKQAAGINILGASFFFSRIDDKRKTSKTFFPAIAYQLAYYDKAFADRINGALLRVPHVVAQLPAIQFLKLIMEPLQEALAVAGNPVLVVIDALDECEHDGDALLEIFAKSIGHMPRMRVFITTRPERHIRNALDRFSNLERFHIQDIEELVVQSDIQLYLDFHLSQEQVRAKLPDLKRTWKPNKKDIEMLIEICGGLFIIASTAVRFIFDGKRLDPAKKLSQLHMDVSCQNFLGSENATRAMDSFYTQILFSAVPDDHDEDDEWFGHYQMIVGTLVVLERPLPCDSLSSLLNIEDDDVIRALSHLHSLVAPTGKDLTFQIHHSTFPDFVTNSLRCERRFVIDLTTRQLELGKQCLKYMGSNLKLIFGSGQNVLGAQNLTESCISQHLAYASTHWATHLFNSARLDDEAEDLLEDFASRHFLTWLQVLSTIGQVEIAYPSLDKITKFLDALACQTITREIFHDGCRFIALNIGLIKVASAHVYSAFAFVPQETRLFRTYCGVEGVKLEVVSGYEKSWNRTISIMTGHEGDVKSVTFSGDGTKLASSSHDGTVRLWDGQTGAEIIVLRGHWYRVNSIVFSPDGKTLVSASDDCTVRMWNGQTDTEIHVLQHSRPVNAVTFSPDGTRLASASNDGTVRIWDSQTGDGIALLQVQGDSRSVTVEFSSDGTKLASAFSDGTVQLWDSRTRVEIAVLRGHPGCSVNSVVFSPDGAKLASASSDGTVRLWDSRTGTELAVLHGHSNQVNSVMFSRDGTKLASASSDKTVRMWDGEVGIEIAVLKGHSNSVNCVVFSPDGLRLASASDDRTVRLWHGQTGAEIAILRGHSSLIQSVAFSADGLRLASASNDRTVRLWDGRTGSEITPQTDSKWVNSVLFSPDGTRLVSSDDDTVRLWDGQTGAEIAVLQGHSKWVDPAIFSGDGMKLASASFDNMVHLWNGKTGAEIAVLRGHSYSVTSLVFSRDGTKLASASADGTLRLWDSQTGTGFVVLEGDFSPIDETGERWHTQTESDRDRPPVNAVAFSPDGTKLASASDDGTVRMSDVQTGAEIALRQVQDSIPVTVEFSLDGTKLASASSNGAVRVWDSQTLAEITVFRGHSDWVNLVLFSPDSTKLASVDEIVRLWDGHSGAEIANSTGTALVAFTLDGSGLLSMNAEEAYQVNCTTGDKNVIPLGLFIDSIVEALRVPDSNLWVVRMSRKQPWMSGLLVVKVDIEGVIRFTSLCWFPPDLAVIKFAVSSPFRIAVGCQDGRILLLDIPDFSSLI